MVQKFFKSLCPPFLWRVGEKIGRKLTRKPVSAEEIRRGQELRKEFDTRNQGHPADTITLRDGLTLKMHPDSRLGFEYFCFRSPTMAVELDCFLQHTNGKQRFMDIGALHGIFSLAFAAADGKRSVLAVDASPIAFARLLYNVHKNDFQNILPMECAVSSDRGTLKMRYEWEHAMAAGAGKSDQTIDVSMHTADQICDQQSFAPDVVKIDVEGHEVKVLKGFRKTLEANRPLVFLEVHPTWITQEGDSIEYIEQLFRELDYEAKKVSGSDFDLANLPDCDAEERLVLIPRNAA